MPSHSSWRYNKILASNISGLQILVFSQYQSGLLVDGHDTCWWALSGWYPRCRLSFGSTGTHQCFSSFLNTLPWSSMLHHVWPAVCLASVLCCQQHRALPGPVLFIGYFKIVRAEIGCRFHRWELSAGVRTWCKCDGAEKLKLAKLTLTSEFCKRWKIWPYLAWNSSSLSWLL